MRFGRRESVIGQAWALLATVLAVAGCDRAIPSVPYSRIGLTRASDGRVEIVFNRCPDERILSVRVILPNDHPVYDLAKSVVLWEVSAREGFGQQEFVIGDVPLGADQPVPLQERYKAAEDVVFVVESTRRESSTSVNLARIRQGAINYDGHFGSRGQFERATQCSRRQP